jgi:membrane fusion protein, heavy metal efflux system
MPRRTVDRLPGRSGGGGRLRAALRGTRLRAALAAAALSAALGYAALYGTAGSATRAGASGQTGAAAAGADTVELKPEQLAAIRIAPIGDHTFVYRKHALGSIDFNQDLNVQVFSPYAGRIVHAYAELGDRVEKGQVLFTIESPDFIAAESALIAAAASLAQTSSALERAERLYAARDMSQNDYESAVAAQHTAEGALRAARAALAVFGKTPAEVGRIVARRLVEPELVVRSPISGRVTARNAAPGLLEQPGNPPAPYSVADLRTKWMVANVTESDSPLYRVGQPMQSTVLAYPGQVFSGRILRLGGSLDPSTHTLMVRCEIADPDDQLIPGMLASFAIQVEKPLTSLAIPMNGVVRNGDGTFTAWVTTDRQRFTQRPIKVGAPLDGEYPVAAGLRRGELAVTDGAVFLSNILFAAPTD